MPHFRLETNLPKEKIPTNFVQELIPVIATSLGKPTNVTCVQIVPDQLMQFGDDASPCGEATLMSVGKLSREENVRHAAAIFAKVTKDLGISPAKLCVRFIDAKPEHIAHNGKVHD